MNYTNGQNVTDNLEKKASNLQKTAKATTGKLEDAAYDVQSVIQSRISDLTDNAVMARDAAESFVRKNPFYAIAGAAAIGLLAGAALSSLRAARR